MKNSTLQAKLLRNYKAELTNLKSIKSAGETSLPTEVWDFTGEIEDETMPIDDAINEVKKRIEILSSSNCTSEQLKELNY